MIKKHLLITLLSIICAAGCVGDILDITDDPASSSDSSSGGDGQPDGSISEVDFNGEVTVTYSLDGATVSGTSD